MYIYYIPIMANFYPPPMLHLHIFASILTKNVHSSYLEHILIHNLQIYFVCMLKLDEFKKKRKCTMMSVISAPAILHHSDSGIRTYRRSLQVLTTCMSRSTWPTCIIHWQALLISMATVINKKALFEMHVECVSRHKAQ